MSSNRTAKSFPPPRRVFLLDCAKIPVYLSLARRKNSGRIKRYMAYPEFKPIELNNQSLFDKAFKDYPPLRKAKMSYHPAEMIKKYTLKARG